MILINLLPPELRRTRRQADPVLYGAIAATAAALLPLAIWAWVDLSLVPAAKERLAAAQADLEAKKITAAKVTADEQSITAFETHRTMLVDLLARKVYWARTLDDFGSYLTGKWPMTGFEVSCTELRIAPAAVAAAARGPAAKSAGPAQIAFAISGKYKLIGEDRAQAGDYINAFFRGTYMHPFWAQHGFVGIPEASYRGDTPEWRPDINRVTIEFNLNWQRVKILETATTTRKRS